MAVFHGQGLAYLGILGKELLQVGGIVVHQIIQRQQHFLGGVLVYIAQAELGAIDGVGQVILGEHGVAALHKGTVGQVNPVDMHVGHFFVLLPHQHVVVIYLAGALPGGDAEGDLLLGEGEDGFRGGQAGGQQQAQGEQQGKQFLHSVGSSLLFFSVTGTPWGEAFIP